MSLRIADRTSLENLEEFLQSATWALARDVEAEISFEPPGNVEPWVLAAVASYALAARRRDMALHVTGFDGSAHALAMGLAPFLELQGVVDASEMAGRMIPLRHIRGNENLRLLFANIVPLLHLADEPEQAKAIQYCISEMVRNVQEHSRAEDGAVVAAEFFPAVPDHPARVSLGIADCGMGIRAALMRNYPTETDQEAVLTAIRPGTSGAPRGIYGLTDNAGAGLFYTRRLARATSGKFALISGQGFFCSGNGDTDRADEELSGTCPRYPGTIVAIEIGVETRFDLTGFFEEAGAAFSEMATRSSKRASQRARFE